MALCRWQRQLFSWVSWGPSPSDGEAAEACPLELRGFRSVDFGRNDFFLEIISFGLDATWRGCILAVAELFLALSRV